MTRTDPTGPLSRDTDSGGILFVLAHPDDETFLCGGTIARYADAGIAVHYACATRGECGTAPSTPIGDRPLAEVRTGELACAGRILGLASIQYLGYRDSGMPGTPDADHPQALVNAPLDEISQKIATIIRTIRPRLVVTHGPFGEYGHPDHIRLHQATRLAYQAAGDARIMPAQASLERSAWSPDALFATSLDPRGIRFLVRLLRLTRRDPHRFGRNADVDLAAIIDNVLPATCVIDVARWVATRDRACTCHRSQLGRERYLLKLPPWIRSRFGRTERYARLIPPAQPGDPIQHELVPAGERRRQHD